jgi:hypothetical protein
VARIHTSLPEDKSGFHGEYLVGKALETFKDDQFEAWFQVDYLPAVTDLDSIIFHPEAGLFLIETKGMKIESIATYSLTEFVLFPTTKKQHPVEQVRTGQHRLKNFLEDLFRRRKLNVRVPFIQTSVVWPQINRSDWIKQFSDQRVQLQAKSMIFKDDLVTPKSLLARLKLLKEAPLLGVFSMRDPIPNEESMIAVREALAPIGVSKNRNDTLTEEIRRAVVHSKQLALTYPPPKKYNVSFEGPPGTGKSTVLREVGLLHAAAGGAVLHVCYNKALAADQRREYEVLKTQGIEYGSIDVFDEWELYKAVHPSWDAYTGKDLERRFKRPDEVAQEINDSKGKPDSHPSAIYDTILIDEAQDLSDSIFQVLDYLARPTASWFASYGEGQEIFFFNKENPSKTFKDWLEKAERKRLRRSFRNSTRAFLMAQNFWENYPKLENCSDWFDEKLGQKRIDDSAMELELDMPTDTNDFKVARLSRSESRLVSIKQLLLEIIEAAKLARRGSDVLIVVGEPHSFAKSAQKTSYESIIEALVELQKNVDLDVLDLIPWENRRNTPKEGTIRIARYQNIRGLSASHVILFDFNELEEWCNEVTSGASRQKGSLNNYGYIAFSRSRVSTTVVLESSENPLEAFIEKSLVMVREKFLAATQVKLGIR